MARSLIQNTDFLTRINHLWDVRSLLLTAGDYEAGKYNAMTIGWGSIGYIWQRPFIQVVVRPTRYTYEFMERYDDFTVCAFPERFRSALKLLGTISGRDGNKIQASGLSPTTSKHVSSPSFAEASLILECKKIYWADLDPSHFLDPRIEKNYPAKDFHRIYFGEILAIFGEREFQAD